MHNLAFLWGLIQRSLMHTVLDTEELRGESVHPPEWDLVPPQGSLLLPVCKNTRHQIPACRTPKQLALTHSHTLTHTRAQILLQHPHYFCHPSEFDLMSCTISNLENWILLLLIVFLICRFGGIITFCGMWNVLSSSGKLGYGAGNYCLHNPVEVHPK